MGSTCTNVCGYGGCTHGVFQSSNVNETKLKYVMLVYLSLFTIYTHNNGTTYGKDITWDVE